LGSIRASALKSPLLIEAPGVVVVHPQADLLHVVGALGAAGRLPRRLHGGQEQRDQHCNDGNHDQELDQREANATKPHGIGTRDASH
jgi:hypothetical protein